MADLLDDFFASLPPVAEPDPLDDFFASLPPVDAGPVEPEDHPSAFVEGLKGAGRGLAAALPFTDFLPGGPIISPVEEANLHKEDATLLDAFTDPALAAETLQGLSRGVTSRLAGAAAGGIPGLIGGGAAQELGEIARESKLDAMRRGEEAEDLSVPAAIDRALNLRERGQDISRGEAAVNMAARVVGGGFADALGLGLAGRAAQTVTKEAAKGVVSQSSVRKAVERLGIPAGQLALESAQGTIGVLSTQGILPGDDAFPEAFAQAYAEQLALSGAIEVGARSPVGKKIFNRSITGNEDKSPVPDVPPEPAPEPDPAFNVAPEPEFEPAPTLSEGFAALDALPAEDDLPVSPEAAFADPLAQQDPADFVPPAPEEISPGGQAFLPAEPDLSETVRVNVEDLFGEPPPRPFGRDIPVDLPPEVEARPLPLAGPVEEATPPAPSKLRILQDGKKSNKTRVTETISSTIRVEKVGKEWRLTEQPANPNEPVFSRGFKRLKEAEAFALRRADRRNEAAFNVAQREAAEVREGALQDTPLTEGQLPFNPDAPRPRSPRPFTGPEDLAPSETPPVAFNRPEEIEPAIPVTDIPDEDPAAILDLPDITSVPESRVPDFSAQSEAASAAARSARELEDPELSAASASEADVLADVARAAADEDPDALDAVLKSEKFNEATDRATEEATGGRIGRGFAAALDDVSERIERFGGEAGKRFVQILRRDAATINMRRAHDTRALKDAFGVKSDKQMKKALQEFAPLHADVVDGKIRLEDLDARQQRAVNAIMDRLDLINQAAQRAGLQVATRFEGMRPSRLERGTFRPMPMKPEVREQLAAGKADTVEKFRDNLRRQGKTDAEIEHIMGTLQDPAKGGFFGGLERERAFDMPEEFLADDAAEVLTDYMHRAHARIAEVANFGQNQAIQLNTKFVLDNLGAEKTDALSDVLRKFRSEAKAFNRAALWGEAKSEINEMRGANKKLKQKVMDSDGSKKSIDALIKEIENLGDRPSFGAWTRMMKYLIKQPPKAVPFDLRDIVKGTRIEDGKLVGAGEHPPSKPRWRKLSKRMNQSVGSGKTEGTGELGRWLLEMERAGMSRKDIDLVKKAYDMEYGVPRELDFGEELVSGLGAAVVTSKVTTNMLNPVLQVMALSNVIGDFGFMKTARTIKRYATEEEVRRQVESLGVAQQNLSQLLGSSRAAKTGVGRSLRKMADWTGEKFGVNMSDRFARHIAAFAAFSHMEETRLLWEKGKEQRLTPAEQRRLERNRRLIGRWNTSLEEGTDLAALDKLFSRAISEDQRNVRMAAAVNESVVQSQAGGGFLHENHWAGRSPLAESIIQLKKFGVRELKTYTRLADNVIKATKSRDRSAMADAWRPFLIRFVASTATGATYSAIKDLVLEGDIWPDDKDFGDKALEALLYGGVMGIAMDAVRNSVWASEQGEDPGDIATEVGLGILSPAGGEMIVNLVRAFFEMLDAAVKNSGSILTGDELVLVDEWMEPLEILKDESVGAKRLESAWQAWVER